MIKACAWNKLVLATAIAAIVFTGCQSRTPETPTISKPTVFHALLSGPDVTVIMTDNPVSATLSNQSDIEKLRNILSAKTTVLPLLSEIAPSESLSTENMGAGVHIEAVRGNLIQRYSIGPSSIGYEVVMKSSGTSDPPVRLISTSMESDKDTYDAIRSLLFEQAGTSGQ